MEWLLNNSLQLIWIVLINKVQQIVINNFERTWHIWQFAKFEHCFFGSFDIIKEGSN